MCTTAKALYVFFFFFLQVCGLLLILGHHFYESMHESMDMFTEKNNSGGTSGKYYSDKPFAIVDARGFAGRGDRHDRHHHQKPYSGEGPPLQ